MLSAVDTVNDGLHAERYRLMERRGSTWLAADLWAGNRVVVKRSDRFIAPRIPALLAQIRHPGLPRLLERLPADRAVSAERLPADRDVPTEHLVFDYAAGATLSELAAPGAGRLRKETWASAFRQLSDVLVYLHQSVECGVVHGDIKPGHLVWSVDRRLTLIDFDTARVLRSSSRKDTDGRSEAETRRAFSPLYAAPEVLGGQISGLSADLYSATLSFISLLSGCPASLCRNRPVDSLIPPGFEGFLPFFRRGLDPLPEQRYGDASEFRCDLAVCLERYLL